MSDLCHSVMKAYSAIFKKTMSDIAYDWLRQNIQQQSVLCDLTDNMLGLIKIEKGLDKRVDKSCWGWRCLVCSKYHKCIVGMYDGLWVPDEVAKKHGKWDAPPEVVRRGRVYDARTNKVWDPKELKYIDLKHSGESNDTSCARCNS